MKYVPLFNVFNLCRLVVLSADRDLLVVVHLLVFYIHQLINGL